MKKNRYKCINILVILVTFLWFLPNYRNLKFFWTSVDIKQVGLLIITVWGVHIIKAMRLYLTLFGSEVSIKEFLKIYCKVTPVSMILPYKIGEVFRIYSYGRLLNSILRGCIIVLLDRFMDTIALVMTIVLISYFYDGSITSLVYVLLVFLALSLVMYYVFPGIYRIRKLNILRSKATENKLRILRVLELLNNIYKEITDVTKGRGFILFLMSLIAWGIEIGSLVILSGAFRNENMGRIISSYLTAAVENGKTLDMLRFVFVSVVMMFITYTSIKLVELIPRKHR